MKKENRAVEWRSVNSKNGLRIREIPDLNVKKIGVIPDSTRVIFLSEIGESVTLNNAKGKWTEIEWDGKKGWVFGRFLVKTDIAEANDSQNKTGLKSAGSNRVYDSVTILCGK